uniref:Glycoprotein hormone subunit beta domain-containing protein n=1 Tax=Knipowitschia caucasica TaxID=637954 RepID=A0AAV2LYW9_KNICA
MNKCQSCAPKNFTLRMETECGQCVLVNTTICSGLCYTQDTNIRGRFGRSFVIQRSCLPQSLVYHSVQVPTCAQSDTPLLYPAAERCHCSRCNKHSHHCFRTRPAPRDRCTQAASKPPAR